MHSAYMSSLAALSRACNREIDRAQLGEPPGPQVVGAIEAVIEQRRLIIQDGFAIETKEAGRG